MLNKYGQDLVELARNQKLDPVIGRDDESAALFAFFPERQRTILCSSASRASAKPPLRRDLRCASCAETCRII